MILFAPHNVLRDPPFAHLDLVSSRNLIIYLTQSAQQRLLDVVHFALRPGGYLFLGISESVEVRADLFAAVDRDAHIFQSRPVPAKLPVPIPELTVPGREEPPALQARPFQPPGGGRRSYGDLHVRLLEEYAPPSILVSAPYDIVHLSEHAGRFLYHAGGEPSHNLLTAIRPELRLELRTALYQAAQQQTPVEARGLTVRSGDGAWRST
jgi:two-component system CheB/CheR fusion protein